MIPLGQCIVCKELCWVSLSALAGLRKVSSVAAAERLDRLRIIKTRAGYMHSHCYLYKGKKMVKKGEIEKKQDKYNAYNRDKRVWI